MSLPVALALLLVGLLLLAGGGELLVRGAVDLARRAGLTPAVIGLTVVALGTSLPELVVSVLAATEGQPDLSVGNVVGSNLFNVLGTLGLAAAIVPLAVTSTAVRLEWPFLFVASWLLLLLARDGLLDRLEGGFFVTSLALFIAYSVRLARRELSAREHAAVAEQVAALGPAGGRARAVLVPTALVLGGMALLVVGGRLLVDGAVSVARGAGLSERVIGLTVVAAGTGAPELATTLVAALRGHVDVAVANMIGSNVFNILGILGVTALILPIPVSAAILQIDLWWMLGATLLLFPLMRTRLTISRIEGLVLLATYAVYLFVLLR